MSCPFALIRCFPLPWVPRHVQAMATSRSDQAAKIAARRDPAPAPDIGFGRAAAVVRLVVTMSPPSSLAIPARKGLLGEVRTTAILAAPLVGGHVSTGLIAFVDNVLAGHHGTTTLASVTIGTALWWLPMMVPIGTLLSRSEERRVGKEWRSRGWP